jgi:hypothetical protein
MFDTNDTLLISMILNKYSDYIYDCMNKTLDYELSLETFKDSKITAIKNGKKTEHLFFPIGTYYKDKEQFQYWKDINEYLLSHLTKHYNLTDIFGSDSTIKKLFKNTVIINFKQHLVIPCFISIMNPGFNVAKFQFTDDKGKIMTNMTMYALVKLNIKCKLDYDKFLDEMSIYKSLSIIAKHYDIKNSKKADKKQKPKKKK